MNSAHHLLDPYHGPIPWTHSMRQKRAAVMHSLAEQAGHCDIRWTILGILQTMTKQTFEWVAIQATNADAV